jgi:predicted enzyme related to lactoylglutathione lyase
MVFKNAINWFEIATADFDRAGGFYETIFDCNLHQVIMGDLNMAGFPIEPGGAVEPLCNSRSFINLLLTGRLFT